MSNLSNGKALMKAMMNEYKTRFPSIGGQHTTSYGHRLINPSLTGVEEMREGIFNLDTASKQKICIHEGSPEPLKNYRAIVSDQSGATFAILTDDYRVVQNKDVFEPVVNAIESAGLNPYGSFYMDHHGRTYGDFMFVEEEYRPLLSHTNKASRSELAHNLGLTKDEPFGLMFRIHNSYDGSMGFGASTGAVRMACMNGNLGWSEFSRFHVRHVGKEQTTEEQQFTRFIKDLPRIATLMQHRIDKATPVAIGEVNDLLYAVGLKGKTVTEVWTGMPAYNPELNPQGMDTYDLYNGVTAYITHKAKSGMFMESTERALAQASRLMEWNYDALLKAGQAMREAEEQKLKAQEKDQAAEKKKQALVNTLTVRTL